MDVRAGPQRKMSTTCISSTKTTGLGLHGVPWTARRSNQSILKEIIPEYSLEGLMLKLKLHIVKAMVFPVVMYRCESWTIKKAEH